MSVADWVDRVKGKEPPARKELRTALDDLDKVMEEISEELKRTAGGNLNGGSDQ